MQRTVHPAALASSLPDEASIRTPLSHQRPFTILEIRLDKNDSGQGKILAGTRPLIDKNNYLVLENYGRQPVRFNGIKRLK